MNCVPCIAWVPKGIAANNPHKLQLSPEELKLLVDETKEYFSKNAENAEDSEDEDEEVTLENEVEATGENDDDDNDDDGEEDFDSKYNLDSYDNDDDQNPLFTINDMAVYVDNRDDELLTDQESEGDLQEKEDFAIKDSDNLLIVGHVEDSSSVLDIYVYNNEEDSFYVHHDIVLPSYPLALEWLDFHAAEDKPGNYVAIGDMSPVIKIWDLDVVDILEPEYKLGKKSKKKQTKKIKGEDTKCHSDAVLSLSWNKLVRNLLASGSADSTVVIWDLEKGNGLNQFSFHSNKVQALQWHPSESPFLLSGCTDGFLKLSDCRSDTESKSWKVSGEIERVVWNINNSFKFFCSTDEGYIHLIDMRKDEIEHSHKAHQEGVTGLDISPLKPEILISASMDKTLKVWDINNFQMLKSMKLKVGSIYTAKAAPDLELVVAVGGDYSSNNLKVMNVFEKKESELKDEQSTSYNSYEDNSYRFKKFKKELESELNEGQSTSYNSYENNSYRFKKIKKEPESKPNEGQSTSYNSFGNNSYSFKKIKKEPGLRKNEESKCTVSRKHIKYTD